MRGLTQSEIQRRMLANVTKDMWNDYRSVQESGIMNMFEHWYAPEIISRFDDLLNWFETEGETDDYDPVAMEAIVELRKKKARRVALREELARLDAELGGEEE
mgnify:FL=1|tara:strand:+ start:157 stop:465 length:309 start_codon:yes stop_codon:yes gene_type:complete